MARGAVAGARRVGLAVADEDLFPGLDAAQRPKDEVYGGPAKMRAHLGAPAGPIEEGPVELHGDVGREVVAAVPAGLVDEAARKRRGQRPELRALAERHDADAAARVAERILVDATARGVVCRLELRHGLGEAAEVAHDVAAPEATLVREDAVTAEEGRPHDDAAVRPRFAGLERLQRPFPAHADSPRLRRGARLLGAAGAHGSFRVASGRSSDERKMSRLKKRRHADMSGGKKSGVLVTDKGDVSFEHVLAECKAGKRPKAQSSEKGRKSVKAWAEWAAERDDGKPHMECARAGSLSASQLTTNARGRVVSLAKSKGAKAKMPDGAWSEKVFQAAVAAPPSPSDDYTHSPVTSESESSSSETPRSESLRSESPLSTDATPRSSISGDAISDTETDVTPRDYVPPGVRREVSDSGASDVSSSGGDVETSEGGESAPSLFGGSDFDDFDALDDDLDEDDEDEDDAPPQKAKKDKTKTGEKATKAVKAEKPEKPVKTVKADTKEMDAKPTSPARTKK